MAIGEFSGKASGYTGLEVLGRLLEHGQRDFYHRILNFANGEDVPFTDAEMSFLQENNFAKPYFEHAETEGQPTDYLKQMAREIESNDGYIMLSTPRDGQSGSSFDADPS